MESKEQLRLLKGLIDHLDNKTNIDAGGIIRAPADTYTSKERFEQEWENFFLNHPQIIGMSGDSTNVISREAPCSAANVAAVSHPAVPPPKITT